MTPSKQTLLALLERAHQTNQQSEVIDRLRWFVHFAEHKSVSKTCEEFGIARSTFYRWFHRLDIDDLFTLENTPKSALVRNPRRAKPQHIHSCPFCVILKWVRSIKLRPARKSALYLAIIAAVINISIFLLIALPHAVNAASSWAPTLIVNTEAFQVIDDSNSSVDLYLQFGGSLNKRLTYNRGLASFVFDDDLEVIGAISGVTIHAQDLLTSSGQLIVEANITFSPASFFLDQNADGSGQLIDSESTLQAALLIDTVEATLDASQDRVNPHIFFGYADTFDTNLFRQKADTLYTDDSLWVGEIMSGAIVKATDSLSSSGTLVWEGAGSGASLYVADGFFGSGLEDCDTAEDDKLLWDTTTQRFSCGTDQGGGTDTVFSGTGALQDFFDNRYVHVEGDTMTGGLLIDVGVGNETNTIEAGLALEVVGTASGEHLHFGRLFTGSGAVKIQNLTDSITSFQIFDADGGDPVFNVDTTNERIGIGTAAPGTTLEVIGTISGALVRAQDTLASSGTLVVEGRTTLNNTLYASTGAILSGHLLPVNDDHVDLGSSDKRWRDLYLGPASVHLGTDGNEAQIGYDITGNEIEFDANDDGTPDLVIEDGGSVGIGTEAPKTLFEVIGSVSGATLNISSAISGSGTFTVESTSIFKSGVTADTISERTGAAGVTIDGFLIKDNFADASAIKVETVDSSVTHTLQDTQNHINPAGRTSGGDVTDAGGGTVNVQAGSGYIRISDNDTAALRFVQWSDSGAIAIASGNTRYFGVGYRDGSPAVVMKTTNTWDYNTDFPLHTATNDAGTMEISNNLHTITSAGGVLKRFYETRPLERDERLGGLIISETGTRNIAVTAGALWARLSRVSISALDTSASDTFDRYYQDGGGGWTKQTGQTQWSNTQYDDLSGTLATLGNNKYAVQWFYVTTEGDLVSVFGQQSNNSAAGAESESAPSTVPDRVNEGGKLLGRIIFKKDDATAIAVQNTFSTLFPTTLTSDHGNLSGLTDDDHTQYALLAGRSGGQTIIGGTAAGDDLTFQTTSDGTKGNLFFGSASTYDEVNDFFGFGTLTPGTRLEVVGTISGSIIHAQDTLTSSGTLSVEGTTRFKSTTDSATFFQVNDTDGGNPVFNVDTIDERIGIGTAAPSASLHIVDDTNGLLHIEAGSSGGSPDSGTRLLIEDNTTARLEFLVPGSGISEAIFFSDAAESGIGQIQYNHTTDELVLEAESILSFRVGNISNRLVIDSSGNVGIGIGTSTVEAELEVAGTISGAVLRGAGLEDCDTDSTDKLLWDTTTGKFSCGTDQSGASSNVFETFAVSGQSNVVADSTTDTLTFAEGSNITITTDAGSDTITIASSGGGSSFSGTGSLQGFFDNRFVRTAGDTMTGALLIDIGFGNESNTADGGIELEVVGSISGSIIHAQDRLTASGLLIVKPLLKEGSGAITAVAVEYQSGAYIFASGASIMNLNSYMGTQSGSNAHIAFGYRDVFDTQLYRYGGYGHSSGGLVLRTQQTSTEENAFAVITQNTSVDNTVFKVRADGEVTADGSFTPGGADLAEWFPTADPGMTSGDIACLDPLRPKHVKRCNGSHLRMIGVISTKPGFVGNNPSTIGGPRALVGLIGQVPVKVIGKVKIGDNIALSKTDAVGKRAGVYDQSICIAIEEHEGPDVGLITCVLSRNSAPPINPRNIAEYLMPFMKEYMKPSGR